MNVTHTKEYNGALNRVNMQKWLLRVMLLATVMLLAIVAKPFQSVEAASSLKLYYNKKNVNYTGQQVTYRLDKKQINNSKYPGIIVDGTSLLPGSDIFNNKVMDTSYTYSSKTKKITIKNSAVTVTMTVNSKTAYINGVKKQMSLAPIIVNYKSTGVNKVMVPARFVSEALGYTYTWNSASSVAVLKVSDSMPLTLHYDNKWHIYTGSRGQVIVDNVNVNLNNMISIIINNTTMVHAKYAFSSSSIKAKYVYNTKDKTITLTKDDIHIVLTLGSKNAIVNGTKKQLPQAPRVLKNKATNQSYIIVPGEAIATYLGYNYSWDSKTKTSVISTKSGVLEPEKPLEPELGEDDTTPSLSDKTYLTYGILPEVEVEYQRIKNIVSSDIEGYYSNIGTLLNIEQDMAEYSNKNIYKVTSSSPFGNISSTYRDKNTLDITLNNMYSTNSTYIMNSGLVKQFVGTFDSTTNQTILSLGLAMENLKYEITLSPDLYTMYVTIYNNYITDLDASYSGNLDTITISSMSGLDPVITQDSTHVYLELPYTVNGIGTQNKLITDGYCIQGISVENISKNTKVTIAKKANSSYVMTEDSENRLIISFYNEAITNYSLTIRKPNGVGIADIKDKDQYNSNKFIITLPGNQLDFLQENPIITINSVVSSVVYSLNSSGNTDITVTTTKLQGYRYTIQGDYIYVQVANPKEIYDKIVVLDAGHGGTAPGTSGGGYSEKQVNYSILVEYASTYFNSKQSPIKAYLTRETDKFITLDDRAAYAKKVGADMFISLHMNSATPTAKGIEVFYSTSNNKTTASGLTSKDLATYFVNQLASELDLVNRKAKTAKFVVVHKNTVPAILIELGFMSNKDDLKKLTDPQFQQDAAKSIYDAVVTTFENYPTGR